LFTRFQRDSSLAVVVVSPSPPSPPPPPPVAVAVAVLGPFHTSERRGGVERRQLELKGVVGGD
jgi:hypothetical protein